MSRNSQKKETAKDTSQIVYVLTNPAMPGLIKIGKTSDLKSRIKSLNGTNVPLPFRCYFAATVADMHVAERIMHRLFGEERINERREFFSTSPEKAKLALMLAMIKEVGISNVDQAAARTRPAATIIRSPKSGIIRNFKNEFHTALQEAQLLGLPAGAEEEEEEGSLVDDFLGALLDDEPDIPRRKKAPVGTSEIEEFLSSLLEPEDDD